MDIDIFCMDEFRIFAALIFAVMMMNILGGGDLKQ